MSKTLSSRIGPGTLDIAIVGMASHFPDAATLYDFWTNIVDKKDSLTDIDQKDGDEYWRKEDYYSADPSAADKTYGHRAGFVPAIDFDPVEFKLPPLMLESPSAPRKSSRCTWPSRQCWTPGWWARTCCRWTKTGWG
ncbi:hypothetical protein JOS77_25210 [Chromobacterium haemolyticum]|nr:hypothetical protein JOS77_25210 [Chromobacterium haemolyticum]